MVNFIQTIWRWFCFERL